MLKHVQVYRCIEKSTGLVLAAKCIKIRKDTDFEKVEKEVNIMTQASAEGGGHQSTQINFF